MRRILTLLAALAGALLALSPAQAARSDQLTLNVNFSYTGQITMTTPGGAPVGTTSGSPTVIPAGYYSLLLEGPGGCTLTPYFMLKGPGVTVTDNMAQGEDQFTEHVVNFLPSSTYTWVNSDSPSVVYTFQTSSAVVGTKAPPVTWNGPTNKGIAVERGRRRLRALCPARGNAHGHGQLERHAHDRVQGQASGDARDRQLHASSSPTRARRTASRSPAAPRSPTHLTAAAFVGRHTWTLNLTTGRWIFATYQGEGDAGHPRRLTRAGPSPGPLPGPRCAFCGYAVTPAAFSACADARRRHRRRADAHAGRVEERVGDRCADRRQRRLARARHEDAARGDGARRGGRAVRLRRAGVGRRDVVALDELERRSSARP